MEGIKKLFGRHLWAIFGLIGAVALACTFFKWDKGGLVFAWDLSSTGVVLIDFLIAAVIFLETEQGRISAFLNDALGDIYARRAALYDAFAETPGDSLGEKARRFADHLRTHPELREAADQQILYFRRAHLMGQGSFLYRNLVADWLPGVAVRIWAMLDIYMTGNDRLGPHVAVGFAKDVITSVGRVHEMEIKYLVIPSKKGDKDVTISVSEMDDIRLQARNYIRRSDTR